jgi:PAS domain S-box-containing protein
VTKEAKKKTGSSGSASFRSRTKTIRSRHLQRTSKISPKDAEKLIRELEAQNRKLREKQQELEDARKRYLDLYDFAPIGYFVLSRDGTIVDLNLTATTMLGLSRNQLIGMPFAFFLPAYSLHEFSQYLKKVFSTNKKTTYEFQINPKYQKSVSHVSIESVAILTDNNATCRCAVIDITERKLAEQEVIKVHQELVERNAQLRRLSARLFETQEEERGRVANDVHDSFASLLCVIKDELQLLLGKGEDDRLNRVIRHLDVAIRDVMRIQMALRPPALDDLGLFSALDALCREFQDSHAHIHVERHFSLEEREMPDSIEVPLYRIAQEALENIAAHSEADSASISLARKNSFIEFVIKDNGRGFNVEEMLSSGKAGGLSTMRERAVLSGGLFFVESGAGKGTTLRISWPFA